MHICKIDELKLDKDLALVLNLHGAYKTGVESVRTSVRVYLNKKVNDLLYISEDYEL